MRLLVLNAGSSSLKYRLYETSRDGTSVEQTAARGAVERIGEGGPSDHSAALREALDELDRRGERFDAAAHRVVHGGERFREPVVVDAETLAAIESAEGLAPLHNGPALEVIRGVRAAFRATPQVAVFDTAFHARLPEHARTYAIPLDLARRRGVRRFGFHGLAYQSILEGWSRASGRPIVGSRLVAFQLGNGASACAIRDGTSIDTSMGFTPLEGLVMGTRSGDVDPAVVSYLAEREGSSGAEIVELLNARSGLLGVSGTSRDIREIESAAEGGDERARLAFDLFCYRARKYLGAYLAVLAGAEAVLFGGGIGEHRPSVRARVLESLDALGLSLDVERNRSHREGIARISSDGSTIEAWVIPTDEETVVAREAGALLAGIGS